MNPFRFLLLSIFLSVFSVSKAQSPWTRADSTTYLQLSYTSIANYSDLFLVDGGNLKTPRTISDRTLQLYAEYGLWEKTSLSLNIPLKFMKAGEATTPTPTIEGGSFESFGNIEIGVKQQLISGPIVLAAQGMFLFPTAVYQAETGLRTGYDAFGFVPGVSVGSSTDKLYGFVYASTYIMGNDYSSSLRTGFEVGYKIIPRFTAMFVFDIFESFENGERIDPANNRLTGLYVNNQEYMSYGLKFAFDIIPEELGITAAGYGAFNGNFVAKEPSLNIGVYFMH